MITPGNRSLLIASYCVLCIQMLIEVVAHPDAKDHVGSITGLLFLIVVLAALILGKPARLLVIATLLNILIATFGTYLILIYVVRHSVGPDDIKDLVARTYFVILLPVFAAKYLVTSARNSRSAAD